MPAGSGWRASRDTATSRRASAFTRATAPNRGTPERRSSERRNNVAPEAAHALQLLLEARSVRVTEGHDQVVHVERVLELLDRGNAIVRCPHHEPILEVVLELE